MKILEFPKSISFDQVIAMHFPHSVEPGYACGYDTLKKGMNLSSNLIRQSRAEIQT
jgi:hypothetical protein